MRGLAKPALWVALVASVHVGPAAAQQPLLRPTQTASQASPPATPDLRRSTSFGSTPDPQSDRVPDFDRSTVPDATRAETSTDLGAVDRMEPREPDLRQQSDRDAFEKPAAGHAPQFFQIEQTRPLRDRRTVQLFEADPFEHIGWRLGAFVLFQELEVSPAWSSNVFFERDARSDWRANFKSETRLVSNWANHAIEFRMLQDRSYHREYSSEDDAGQTYELRGRLDITSRTTAEAVVAREIAQESRNAIDARGTLNNTRPDVITDRINLALNLRFNRLSLQLRGGQSDTAYEEEATTTATDDRDTRTRTVALRAQWEFRPTLSIFGEFERDSRRHDAVAASDGLTRDSDGERYRAGVALGQTGEILRGEASIGYGVQRPNAAALPDIEAFLVDANVAWRITPLTSLLVEAATNFNETTLAGSPGVVSRRIGARLRHSFTDRLIGEAGVSYSTQDYANAVLSERSTTLNATVEYSINRHAALFSRIGHTRFRSNDTARDYNATTLMLGARLRN